MTNRIWRLVRRWELSSPSTVHVERLWPPKVNCVVPKPGGRDALHSRPEKVKSVDVAGRDGQGANGPLIQHFALGHIADGDQRGFGIHRNAFGGRAHFQSNVNAGLLADGEPNAGLLVVSEAGGHSAQFVLADAEKREAKVAFLVGRADHFSVGRPVARGDFRGGDESARLVADITVQRGVGGVGLGPQGERDKSKTERLHAHQGRSGSVTA